MLKCYAGVSLEELFKNFYGNDGDAIGTFSLQIVMGSLHEMHSGESSAASQCQIVHYSSQDLISLASPIS